MVAALVLLPLSSGLGGCAGTRPSDSRAALRSTRDNLRVFLKERAADPAEAERFLALADAIEDRALALLGEVARFDADFYAALYRYLRESRDFDMGPGNLDSDIFNDAVTAHTWEAAAKLQLFLQ